MGETPSGLALYAFRYVWGGPMMVGVMAQDLQATHPDAVIVGPGGYLMVDYDRIDARMTTLEEYERALALV